MGGGKLGERENKTCSKVNSTTLFEITEILLYNTALIFSTGKLPKFQISKLYLKPLFSSYLLGDQRWNLHYISPQPPTDTTAELSLLT